MGIISYNEKEFLMDGKPYTIISGAMHYFRIPEQYWYDRLLKMKECGFNTVETYTCWNLHEPQEGVFDFTGMLNIEKYITIAESLGLNVIVRPGPYICAEWEFGGLPSWLLKYENIALRCNDSLFISKVRRYYSELLKYVVPHMSSKGGPVIMMQIENEYGSYGDDKEYLGAIVDIYRENGVDCQMYTSDGACTWMLSGGTLPEYLCVANFGSKPKENFAVLDSFRTGQPHMCGEYWCGWFDSLYGGHHVRDAKELAGLFGDMIDAGASLNFYMFHGGTNFGFHNGANYYDEYLPQTTSYDYNALLSEAGDMTPAYYAVREIIENRFGKLPEITSKNSEKAAYGKVKLTQKAFILDTVNSMTAPVHSAAPLYMEEIGQAFGYILYSTEVKGPIDQLEFLYKDCHDRAIVYIDGVKQGWIERTHHKDTITIGPIAAGDSVKLDILVENMGRVNYGPKLRDKKGMTGIRFGLRLHFGWDMYSLPMEKELAKVEYVPCDGGVDKASFLRGELIIDGEPKDTFIRLDGFNHGFVTVNGFNLGRYYMGVSPTRTLYCPAPMLKPGKNEIIVFETDGCKINEIEFTDTPDLGDPII